MGLSNVLIVEDDTDLREALSDTLSLAGYQARSVSSAEDALIQIDRNAPDIVVSDVQMSGMSGHELLQKVRAINDSIPFVLMTAYGNVNAAVKAMQEGASDYLEKPFAPGKLVTIIEKYLKLGPPDEDEDVIIVDKHSADLFALARKVATSDATVLLTGPSGTGKEVLAHYIHRHSHRSLHPFVAINCAAIPENMLEATLFGYEKGAFTGAHQAHPGKFELAQDGTILLDEISEMDLGLQAKLLRVLQEKEVERLGGRKTLALNVRVIATTNRNLRNEVEKKTFREDLFYRLNVFPLQCLPLNERRDDIIPLAEHMLRRYADKSHVRVPKFSNTAKQLLKAYQWPGNVRELENNIQRALIVQNGEFIEAQDLQIFQVNNVESLRPAVRPVHTKEDLGQSVKEHEFTIVIETLEKYQGNRKKVAEALGISPRTLRYKLAKMRENGIEIPK